MSKQPAKHIDRIEIENIGNITEPVVLEPGVLNVISGPNGSGKTTILRAIQAALVSGKSFGHVVNTGADKGEVCINYLDNMSVRSRIPAEGQVSSLIEIDGRKIEKPRNYLKALFDGWNFNMADVVNSAPKDLVNAIAEASITEIDYDRLNKIIKNSGVKFEDLYSEEFDDGRPAMELLEEVESIIYKDRTPDNVKRNELKAHCKKLKSAIPEDSGDDWNQLLEDNDAFTREVNSILNDQIEEIRNTSAAKRVKLQDVRGNMLEEAHATKSKSMDELIVFKKTRQEAINDKYFEYQKIITDIEAKLAEVEAECDHDIESMKEVLNIDSASKERAMEAEYKANTDAVEVDRQLEEVDKDEESEITTLKLSITDRLSELREENARIRSNIDQDVKARELKKIYAEQRQQLDKVTEIRDIKSEAISKVKIMREDILQDSPIDGLTFEEGHVFVDGVRFDQLNTALKLKLILQVSAARGKKEGSSLLLIDGGECLDKKNLEEFLAKSKELGVQLFITVVDNSDGVKFTAKDKEQGGLFNE